MRRLKTPLTPAQLSTLRAGESVRISGTVYGARDAAHQRLVEMLQAGDTLPFDLTGALIYYVGPAPASPGHAVGPAGPTTSGRMDPYTLPMLEAGVKGFLGKGYRSESVRSALLEHGAVYLATVGGAAALLSRSIRSARIVAFEDLGTEAIHEFEFIDFPAFVIHDLYGGDAYVKFASSESETGGG